MREGFASSATSLWTAVEARLLHYLSDANEGMRKPVKANPYEDSTQSDRVMREGWWPKLLHWVSIITATKSSRAHTRPYGIH